LLECKYIFFLGYFTNVFFVTLVEDDDKLARCLLISFMSWLEIWLCCEQKKTNSRLVIMFYRKWEKEKTATSSGSSSSSLFLISCKTRQRVGGSSSSSPTKDNNEPRFVIVFLCFVHYLQMMTMSWRFIIVDFFSILEKDDGESTFVVIFFLFCFCAPRENNDDK
jgi:hypothetical protein